MINKLRYFARRLQSGLIRASDLIPIPMHLANGAWWLTSNDIISHHLRHHEDFEQGEQRFLSQFLQPGMTVLDLGAHHGLYTLLASRMVGRSGQVIAFEPSPRERRRLQTHIWLNRCSNTRVESLALGKADGVGHLYVVQNWESGCNSMRPPAVSQSTAEVLVQLTTLDRYLSGHIIGRVDFIKMDVEGGELDVLIGADNLLSAPFRPIFMYELADVRTQVWDYPSVKIYDHFASRGYQQFSVTPRGSLKPCPRMDHYNENLIAVPGERIDAVTAFADEPEQV